MSKTVYQYKIYCNTESTYVTGWGTTAPTTCYNNTGHSVNVNSVQVVDTVQSNEVVINQASVAPANRSFTDAFSVSGATAGATTTQTYTFRTSMSLYSLTIAVPEVTFGDTISLSLNPNTSLGLITADVTAGSTIVYVSSAVVRFLFPGMYVKLSDGTNSDIDIKVLSQDTINSKITLISPVANSYLSTNTQIYLTYYAMHNMPVIMSELYRFGNEIFNARNIPAGSVARIDYYNAGETSKNLIIYFSGLI